jgi:hypothetical protein
MTAKALIIVGVTIGIVSFFGLQKIIRNQRAIAESGT